MDEKRWYICNPEKNRDCRKGSCCERGGPCRLTSREDCAMTDAAGIPIEVNPRQLLREQVDRRRREDGNRRKGQLC